MDRAQVLRRNSPFVLPTEKVSDLWVQLMKDGNHTEAMSWYFLLSEHKKDRGINVRHVQSWYFKSRSWPRLSREALKRLFIRDDGRHLTHTPTFSFLTFGFSDVLTHGWTVVLFVGCVCEWCSPCVFRAQCVWACVRACAPHTFLCQHNAASCNVYFMLCWPSPRVELQQPSNIHAAEAHLHIKGPRAAKSTWSEYLSLAVPLSLSPYVSCLSLPFQLSALPPLLPPNTPTFLF